VSLARLSVRSGELKQRLIELITKQQAQADIKTCGDPGQLGLLYARFDQRPI
jgi:hypothetical protein